MYKYYKELEHPNDFVTYLDKGREDHVDRVLGVGVDIDTLKLIKPLLSKINTIQLLISSLDEDIVCSSLDYNKLSYDEMLDIGGFFSRREESYNCLAYDYNKIDFDLNTIIYMLEEIVIMSNALTIMCPMQKKFINSTVEEIKAVLKKIKHKTSIELTKKEDNTVKWPNAWYITPNGYLYNTGLGHKEGNLVYPLYYDIFERLNHNGTIKEHNNTQKIKEIIRRGYVVEREFQNFSNLIYGLPTIITPEVERDMEVFDSMLKMTEAERSRLRWPNMKRSYQRNIMTLVTGHLDAETCLFRSFMVFNSCEDKTKIPYRLQKLSFFSMDDILVRFSKFSKISSLGDKIINTSSLTPVKDFSEYLDRGWTIDIVPGITYDRVSDTLSMVNLDSLMISRHLDREIESYHGKGKILVAKKLDY